MLPRAVLGILVRTPAQEARPVAEPLSLNLVVAHLADELWADGRLFQPATFGRPAVRLREATLRRVDEKRENASGDLVVLAGGDRGRPHVVDVAVVSVDAEQERRNR